MSYSPPSSAKPFTLHIPDQDLTDWRQLLSLSKLPPQTWEGSQPDDRYGVTHSWLSSAKDYWLNTYSWRAEEERINSYPNYRMPISGVDVHFIALFSGRKDAVPIMFMHGWPGSFIEFLPMLDVIRTQYPDAAQLPYHIIVPSLPGYPLSPRPVDKDWTVEDSSRVLNTLMLNLGFTQYLAQGGDVGSFNARVLAQQHEACIGIHLNMMTVKDKPDEAKLSPLEKKAMQSASKWRETGSAYAQEHGTKPSTIGSVLSSNPLALLAWISEKFLSWSSPTTTPPLTTILTNISLYYFTASILTSLYPYRQLQGPSSSLSRTLETYISKPVGFSFFPNELFPGIREVLERHARLVSYVQHEEGGHFAALEKPRGLWADVEGFVGVAWGKEIGARL